MARTALLAAATTTGAGTSFVADGSNEALFIYGTWGVGGTVTVELSADGTNWITDASFTADGIYQPSETLPPGCQVRPNVTAGTAISLNVDRVH